MILFLLLTIVAALAVYAFYSVSKTLNYWKDKGIKYVPAESILSALNLVRGKSFAEKVRDIYDYHDDRYFGAFQFHSPILLIKDPDLLKQVAVKNFDSFLDHRQFIPADMDPLVGKNLFATTGEKWKKLRATLSPSFTSSKMRAMFLLMNECSKQFVSHFQKKSGNVIDVEIKDVSTKYTNDVIATCAFGFDCNSLENPENEFYNAGRTASTLFRGLGGLFRITAYIAAPMFARLIGLRLIPKEISDYFTHVVNETVKSRKEKGIVRPDLIHLLMQASKGIQDTEKDSKFEKEFASTEEFDLGVETKQHSSSVLVDNEDLVAQAFIFFLAGFDTASTLMCFLAYELVANPDIQDKLREEIRRTEEKCDGKITYEELLKMKYLDMVVSETLRKWPPAVVTDRMCTKSFTIQPELPHEKPYTVEKGTNCSIIIWGFHRDAKHFPHPEKFDPERFSEENKHNINPFAYIPFGVGPRNCIGSRFALLETKLLVYRILLNFEIVPTEKSKIPLVLSKVSVNPHAEGGFNYGFKKL